MSSERLFDSDDDLPQKTLVEKLNPQFWPQWAKMYLMSWGMFTAAYDLLVINLVLLILTKDYGATDLQNSYIATACILGTIIGQLAGGYFADIFGRVVLARVTCSILIIGALGAGFVSWDIGPINMFIFLAIWRLVTGLGVGGEYPVGAIFTAEAADDPKTRGSNTAAVFSAQGIGNLSTSVLFLLLLAIFGNFSVEFVWRVALALGAVPALIILLPRCLLKENILKNQKSNKAEASPFVSEQQQLPQKLIFKIILKYYWKRILGTAGCWFVFDIVFYGNSLFSSQILASVGDSIASNVAGNIIIALIALPGYWFAVFTIDIVGRKPLQIFGFVGMTIMYIAVGIFYRQIVQFPVVFVLLYGMSYFFGNAGPNTTTYVLPTETFPSKIRSTCHGFSAAAGKLGAFVGSSMMKPLLEYGIGYVLILCGLLSILGLILTIFFIQERKGVDLKELEIEFSSYVNQLDIQDFEAIDTVVN